MMSPTNPSRLLRITSRIKSPSELKPLLATWRFREEKIVFTNGCFDILHRGHIEYLAAAAELGSVLIIGMNTDDSVRRQNKGPDRPVNNQESRALLLAALNFTSAVVLFDEDTPENIIREVRPDFLVKGKDWEGKSIAGADFVESYGGQVKTIDLTEGYSTTGILEKIRSNG